MTCRLTFTNSRRALKPRPRVPHPYDEERRERTIIRAVERQDWPLLSIEELESLELFLRREAPGCELHARVCARLGLPEPPLPGREGW